MPSSSSLLASTLLKNRQTLSRKVQRQLDPIPPLSDQGTISEHRNLLARPTLNDVTRHSNEAASLTENSQQENPERAKGPIAHSEKLIHFSGEAPPGTPETVTHICASTMPQGKIQDTKGSQGTMDSSGSTKRIAAIAGGAAGAAVVAAIAVGFFVFFRRRRARRKHMVAYLKHQQHELEAHHQQVQQCKTLASNIEDQDRMLAMNGHPPLGPSIRGSPVLSHEPSATQVHSPVSYYLGQGRRLSSKPWSPKSGPKNQAALTSARNAAYEHSREGNPFYHPDLGPEYYTGFPIVISPCMQQYQDLADPLYPEPPSLPPPPRHQPPPPPIHSVLSLSHNPERYRYYYEQASRHSYQYHPSPSRYSAPSTKNPRRVAHRHTLANSLPPHPRGPLPPVPSLDSANDHHHTTTYHATKETSPTANSLQADVNTTTPYLHDVNSSSEVSSSLSPPPRTSHSPPRYTTTATDDLVHDKQSPLHPSLNDASSQLPTPTSNVISSRPLATEVTPAAAPSDCYRPSDDTKPTTITSPKSSSPQPAASADLDRSAASKRISSISFVGSPSCGNHLWPEGYSSAPSPMSSGSPTPTRGAGSHFSLSQWCTETSVESDTLPPKNITTPLPASSFSLMTTTEVSGSIPAIVPSRPLSVLQSEVCCNMVVSATPNLCRADSSNSCCGGTESAEEMNYTRQGEVPFGPLSPMP